MDLEKLRQARLSRYGGGGGELTNSSATNPPAAIGAIGAIAGSPEVDGTLTDSHGGPSGGPSGGPMLTSDAEVLNMLKEVRDLLVQLPGNIAAALAADAVTPVAAGPSVAPAAAPPVIEFEEITYDPATNNEYEDIFAENNGDNYNACGVCHIPVDGEVYAFDQCGHYPFCSPCASEVKKTTGPSKCPYCKSLGKAVILNLED